MWSRRLVVPLVLCASGLGWAAAHAVAHRVAMPNGASSGATGFQGYLAYLPTSLALCLALALPLAAGAALGRRWRGSPARSLWLFGIVPVLGFAGHALVEPLASGSRTLGGTVAAAATLAPILAVGLLAQVPFALVALALARRIFAVAERLAATFVRPRLGAGRPEPQRYAAPDDVRPPVFRLDHSRSQRAPPAPASV